MKRKSKEIAEFTQLSSSYSKTSIDVVDACFELQNFSKHVHEGYTIGVIERGAQRFYRSGAEHLAGGSSSIILVNADDVHTGRSASEGGWSYRALYPAPEHFQSLCRGLFDNNDGVPYFKEAVVDDLELANQIRLLLTIFKNRSDPLLIESMLFSTLVNLVQRHSLRPANLKKKASAKLNKLAIVRDFLEQTYRDSPKLDQLSKISGVSGYHLIRQFKEHFGIPPHQYLIQVRLKKARELLKQGCSPSLVAVDCGFYDQSHLTVHFKKAMGTTPYHYQKSSNILQ